MNKQIIIEVYVIIIEYKKCGGTNHYKNRFVKRKQRYKCKKCGYKNLCYRQLEVIC